MLIDGPVVLREVRVLKYVAIAATKIMVGLVIYVNKYLLQSRI